MPITTIITIVVIRIVILEILHIMVLRTTIPLIILSICRK